MNVADHPKTRWQSRSRHSAHPGDFFSLYIYAVVALNTLFQFPSWRSTALRGLTLINNYPVGPFEVALNRGTGILSKLALTNVIMLRRSITMSRQQAQLDAELQAAREVQRILVPEHRGSVPGFTVESAYEPAQQVGGDFFQFIPAGQGDLLIVVGDVAGKGLPAAMLVSVLVGAIGGLSEYAGSRGTPCRVERAPRGPFWWWILHRRRRALCRQRHR